MRELEHAEILSIDGGNGLACVGAAVLVYETANILYDFANGFMDGISGR